MNSPSNALPESGPGSPPPATTSPLSSGVTDPGYNTAATRPFYWSVRRELWENRSIYLAPVGVAAVLLFGFMASTIGLAERRRAVLLLEPTAQRARIGEPYDMAVTTLIFTAFVVGVIYCLDALHGERRDRSILFWKSMPVSDLTTVLSKATIPLVVLPMFTFAAIVCVQVIMLLYTSVVLILHGMSPATTWAHLPMVRDWAVLLYFLVVFTLWYAPIYGWLLLVSSWARRATFLWAVLPIIAIKILEKVSFLTSYFAGTVTTRLIGFLPAFEGQSRPTIDPLARLTPGRFLSTPGLWLGLLFAAACLIAAARLRRSRGPI